MERRAPWDVKTLPIERLQTMTEHRPVDLLQDVTANLNSHVGVHPKDVGVERSVMNLAERKTIRNNGVTEWLVIGNDMRRVEQLDDA